MNGLARALAWWLAALTAAVCGCRWYGGDGFTPVDARLYETIASEMEYPAESDATLSYTDESLAAPQPWTVNTEGTPEYWDLSLEEAIQLALCNSRVLRDLGGAVVRAPGSTRTTWDPALVEADPRFGIEAALSEFDAQLMTSVFWEKNDRAINNEFFGGGTRLLQQDAGIFQSALTKKAATGSQFTIRHNVDYDANNAPGNIFLSAWSTNVETEIRQPFLRGFGTQYNRIAGSSETPGIYNGVLVARLNADVAITEFETAVRDLVSNVENAYWDLYAGYRALDSLVTARDQALDTWRRIYAWNQEERAGGEADKEAQAREHYYRLQQDVQNALSGEPLDRTRNWNGLPGGTFRSTEGVLMAERRLRLLMGLPPSDGRLLRPADEPVLAKIEFDWEQVKDDAVTRRSELQRQKWQIRRRELELIASKNHLLPQLDGVARYRWRGFGDDLFPRGAPPPPPNERFDGAYSDLTSGDFQEWQLGFELSIPIGYRQAHAEVRYAELLLARARAILKDQQREIIHEAADAIAELDRAYTVLQTNYNRVLASRDQLEALSAREASGQSVPLDLLLDAQRNVADTEAAFARNRALYAVAAKNVHFVAGTLLEQDGVYLAEGPWPGAAYHDAAELASRRLRPQKLNNASSQAPVVSRGPYLQIREKEPAAEELPILDLEGDPFRDEPLPGPILDGPPAMPSPDESLPMRAADERPPMELPDEPLMMRSPEEPLPADPAE